MVSLSMAFNILLWCHKSLSKMNFLWWKDRFYTALIVNDLVYMVDELFVPPYRVISNLLEPNFEIWIRMNFLVLSWMMVTISPQLCPQIHKEVFAYWHGEHLRQPCHRNQSNKLEIWKIKFECSRKLAILAWQITYSKWNYWLIPSKLSMRLLGKRIWLISLLMVWVLSLTIFWITCISKTISLDKIFNILIQEESLLKGLNLVSVEELCFYEIPTR